MSCSVLVLMGGPDEEHDVSVNSGRAVAEALRAAGHRVHEEVIERIHASQLSTFDQDVVFPVLHGAWGEGGALQRELDAAGSRYVGSGPNAATTAMDKDATKTLAVQLGVPTPAWELMHDGDACTMPCPVVVKAPREGSSIDLFICHDEEERARRIKELTRRHRSIMVEQYVAGRELTVGVVLGEAMPIIEIIPATDSYDYEAKYLRDDTSYVLDPELTDDAREACLDAAVRLGTAIGCRDLWRADFMLDDRGPWLLELNTMPGFTSHSLLPKAAAHAGRPMERLCHDLVEHALQRV